MEKYLTKIESHYKVITYLLFYAANYKQICIFLYKFVYVVNTGSSPTAESSKAEFSNIQSR